jgi:hypothetical protein
MRNYGLRQIEPATRIVLICPDCGQENSEFAASLRAASTYCCNGEDCDYIFDLGRRGRSDYSNGFAEACKRFYAAFCTMRTTRTT